MQFSWTVWYCTSSQSDKNAQVIVVLSDWVVENKLFCILILWSCVTSPGYLWETRTGLTCFKKTTVLGELHVNRRAVSVFWIHNHRTPHIYSNPVYRRLSFVVSATQTQAGPLWAGDPFLTVSYVARRKNNLSLAQNIPGDSKYHELDRRTWCHRATTNYPKILLVEDTPEGRSAAGGLANQRATCAVTIALLLGPSVKSQSHQGYYYLLLLFC